MDDNPYAAPHESTPAKSVLARLESVVDTVIVVVVGLVLSVLFLVLGPLLLFLLAVLFGMDPMPVPN